MGTPGTTLVAGAPDATAPTCGTARWARGAAVGLTATMLAMAGHAAVGGDTPPALPSAILTGAVVLGSVGLSGRRWTLGALIGVLLLTQAAFHVLLDDRAGAAAGHAASHRHAEVAGHVMLARPPGLWMVTAHLVAALLTALLLRRGESWCWRLFALIAAPLRAARLLAAPAAVAKARAVVRTGNGSMFRQIRLLVLSQARRGPPAVVAV